MEPAGPVPAGSRVASGRLIPSLATRARMVMPAPPVTSGGAGRTENRSRSLPKQGRGTKEASQDGPRRGRPGRERRRRIFTAPPGSPGPHVGHAGRGKQRARSAMRTDCPLAYGVPRGIEVRTNEPGGGPEGRRVHDRPTLAPRAARSSSSCSNVSLITSAAPVPAASRASFEG
jgi:hypothetical protein